jgi:hypothetical protein
VEHTDIAIGAFRDAFGDEAGQEFQAKVGDDALPTLAVAEGMLVDDSKLRALYDENETSDGALSVEGAYHAAEHLAARLGVGSLEELSAQHPMLDEFFLDGYAEDTGTLSATAVHRILAYVGRTLGYRFHYRDTGRPPSNPTQENTMSDDTKILAQIAEAEYENRLAEIRAQIEDAQAKGESKRRDRLYQQELALIAKVKGNGPIVNGRRTA